jgi:ParB family chromosome partitioning protein
MTRFGHTQEKLAEALSKSRSHVANLLRLLTLPDDVQELVRDGKLSAGHARALIGSPKASELAAQIVAKGLSVREVERLMKAQDGSKPAGAKAPRPVEKDADTRALEGDLSANLKMPVRIEHSAGGESGELVIRYGSLDDLDKLCRILSQLPDED